MSDVELVLVPWKQRYFGVYDFRKFGIPMASIGLGLVAIVLTFRGEEAGGAILPARFAGRWENRKELSKGA